MAIIRSSIASILIWLAFPIMVSNLEDMAQKETFIASIIFLYVVSLMICLFYSTLLYGIVENNPIHPKFKTEHYKEKLIFITCGFIPLVNTIIIFNEIQQLYSFFSKEED